MQQTSVKYGIITGMAIVLYLFVFHQINRELVLNPLVYWSPIAVSLLAMTMVVRKEREANGGKIEQRVALKHAFLTFVVCYFFFAFFSFILFKYVDPGLAEVQKKAMVDAGREIDDLDSNLTIGKFLPIYVFMHIPGFLLSYMVASFMKK